MNIRFQNLVVVATLLVAGCASPLPQLDYYDIETEALQKIRGMTIIEEDAREYRSYRELGEVQGLYCNRTKAYAGSPESSAVDQVKLRAAIKGADHIGTPQCETRTTWDFTNNCFSTVTCSAAALVQAE